MSERFNASYNTGDVKYDPELRETLDFLATYQKIQGIMAWLAESGPASDPLVKVIRRTHLHRLIGQLGLDPEDPASFSKLEDIRLGLIDRTKHPKPRVDVPDVGFFKQRIEEIIEDYEESGPPLAYIDAENGIANLRNVAEYGHTDWRSVRSRAGESKDVSAWIHGVARVMADPIAYQATFAGMRIDTVHQAPDHLTLDEDWTVLNGRHRSLAARSLGVDFIEAAGMSQWVKVAIEPSQSQL